MELVTGKAAADHISSADMASFYRGLLVAEDVVLDTGDKLSCTMLDANTAEIGTGDCMLQAHHARVEVAEQLTVRSGSQGFNRNDLVVARYSLGEGNIQSVYLAIVEGTAVAGEAEDPDCTEGDIDGGAVLAEFPIWRIPITGVNVGDPERIMPTVDTLQDQIATLRDSVDKQLAFTPNTTNCSVNRFTGWALQDGSHGAFNAEVKTLTTSGELGSISILPSHEICMLVVEIDNAGNNHNGWVRSNGSLAYGYNVRAINRLTLMAAW